MPSPARPNRPLSALAAVLVGLSLSACSSSEGEVSPPAAVLQEAPGEPASLPEPALAGEEPTPPEPVAGVAEGELDLNLSDQELAASGALSASVPAQYPAVPAPAPQSVPGESGGRCHPSYPDLCLPTDAGDLDCKDIPEKNFRVLAPDPFRLDREGDGIGCERR